MPKTVEQNGAPHYGNTEDETLRKSQVVNDLDKDYEEDSEDQSGSHTTKGNIKRIKDKETKVCSLKTMVNRRHDSQVTIQ